MLDIRQFVSDLAHCASISDLHNFSGIQFSFWTVDRILDSWMWGSNEILINVSVNLLFWCILHHRMCSSNREYYCELLNDFSTLTVWRKFSGISHICFFVLQWVCGSASDDRGLKLMQIVACSLCWYIEKAFLLKDLNLVQFRQRWSCFSYLYAILCAPQDET